MVKWFSRGLSLLGLCLVVLLLVVPALAISNPTSTAIYRVAVFENIFEDGDWIFFVRYDVAYPEDPDPPASDTFLVALYDTDGSTLLYQRPLNYYDHNIISLYLTPVRASALSWGGAYVVKVTGNPSVFGDLEEGVNVATKTLSGDYNYVSGDMEDSRDDFGGFCLATAGELEDDPDWPDLLTSTGLLNTRGADTFNKAIPGLQTACPNIYSTSVVGPVLPGTSRTITLTGDIAGDFTADETVVGETSGVSATFIGGTQEWNTIQVRHSEVNMFEEDETARGGVSGATIEVSDIIVGKLAETAASRTGPRLRGALDNFGAWLGISGNALGGFLVLVFYALTAGFIFVRTGSTHGGIILAVPVVLVGNFIGIFPFVITWIVIILIATLFAVTFIMARIP